MLSFQFVDCPFESNGISSLIMIPYFLSICAVESELVDACEMGRFRWSVVRCTLFTLGFEVLESFCEVVLFQEYLYGFLNFHVLIINLKWIAFYEEKLFKILVCFLKLIRANIILTIWYNSNFSFLNTDDNFLSPPQIILKAFPSIWYNLWPKSTFLS